MPAIPAISSAESGTACRCPMSAATLARTWSRTPFPAATRVRARLFVEPLRSEVDTVRPRDRSGFRIDPHLGEVGRVR